MPHAGFVSHCLRCIHSIPVVRLLQGSRPGGVQADLEDFPLLGVREEQQILPAPAKKSAKLAIAESKKSAKFEMGNSSFGPKKGQLFIQLYCSFKYVKICKLMRPKKLLV